MWELISFPMLCDNIVCFCCFFSTSRVDHSNTRLSSQLDRSPGNWMLLFSTLAALSFNTYIFILFLFTRGLSSGGEVLAYVGYVGMRCPKGYGFQAVYSHIGHVNQRVWVYNRVSFQGNWSIFWSFWGRLGKPRIKVNWKVIDRFVFNYLAVDNAGETADNKHTGSTIFRFFPLESKTDKPLGDNTFQNRSVKLICWQAFSFIRFFNRFFVVSFEAEIDVF